MHAQENGKILIVDDEFNARRILSRILSADGFTILESQDAQRALEMLPSFKPDAVITDVKMPGMDGINFFEQLKNACPNTPVVFLTAFGTVESAVSAMTAGAYHYLIKPPDFDNLKEIIKNAIASRKEISKFEVFRAEIGRESYERAIIAKSEKMLDLLRTVQEIKDSKANVLITGETGTGKEVIAQFLHSQSLRNPKPFVAVNCAAIPKELLESEMFGSEKGAYTGAYARKIGKFEEANGGSVFLDEISELQLMLQAKLLRVLQEREIQRLGSNQRIGLDFRLISSSNLDLLEQVETRRFREDLYYRINVLHLHLPPLRERIDDIVPLAEHFLRRFCIREAKAVQFKDEVIEFFQEYSWPGNVRQLINVVERAVVMAKGERIERRNLPEEIVGSQRKRKFRDIVVSLKILESNAVKEAMHACKGNKSKAARALGISRKALYKRLREIDFE